MIKRTKIRSNGITFLYDQNQSAGSVTAALFFKSGLLWEKEKEYGATRFVQELLFRELAATPVGAAGQRIGRDHAVFFCEAPPENALAAIQTLASVTETEPFSTDRIEAVRSDLLRECASFVPAQEDETERLYFGLPAYAVPPCGTEQTIGNLTPTQLERRRTEYFNRANACFILTGDFSDSQLKEVETFLRELPPQKHRSLNLKPQFPPEQFFRTSAEDRYLPTESDVGRIELLFEIDLCETQPVWAAMLRRLLAEPRTGVLQTAMTKAKLTDEVHSELRIYQGFAVLRLSCAVFHRDIPAAVATLSESVAAFKEELPEAQAAALLPYYTKNRLARHTFGAERAYELGLHHFILYTDDIILPERRSIDDVMEQLTQAADDVLIPDNALFLIYYNEKHGADLPAIRKSLAASRVRLFV